MSCRTRRRKSCGVNSCRARTRKSSGPVSCPRRSSKSGSPRCTRSSSTPYTSQREQIHPNPAASQPPPPLSFSLTHFIAQPPRPCEGYFSYLSSLSLSLTLTIVQLAMSFESFFAPPLFLFLSLSHFIPCNLHCYARGRLLSPY